MQGMRQKAEALRAKRRTRRALTARGEVENCMPGSSEGWIWL